VRHSLTGNGSKFAAGKGEDFDGDMCVPEARAAAEAQVVYGLLWTS